ncbi:MAG: AAA family ATPase [Planctomycetes bacterium]|nr:AAA family ATPase [Planctomycetota bacterium]
MKASQGDWLAVNKSLPCPICGKPDWCAQSENGAVRCMRISDPPAGWQLVKRNDDGGTVYRRDGEPDRHANLAGVKTKPAKNSRTYSTLEAAIEAATKFTGGEFVKHWSYERSEGIEAFIVCRFNLKDGSKQFRPIHKCDDGKFIIADPPGLLPLYRLPELQDAARVYVCEGEKAAEAARSIELIATTSAHGSKSAAKSDWQPLAGKDVVILPDNDSAGEIYAANVAGILHGLGCTVRIVTLPDLPKGGDIFDWIEARECIESESLRDEVACLAGAAPVWQPSENQSQSQYGRSEPIIVRLSDVEPEQVAWLWPGRIALGKLTLIAGDPGLGKSFLTLDMAARVSNGMPWPDRPNEANPSGGIVLLSAEDDLADTIRPRLDAANANVSRIQALKAIRSVGGTERMFNLSRDLPNLEVAIKLVGDCRLVVIDPVTAYLGGVDSHKNAEIRGLLAPLGELAARHRVAVVAVTHLNKSGFGPAIYRAMGSLAFAAAARAAWAVSKDKNDPLRRLLLPIKNNIAPDTGGLAYRIEPVGLIGCPVVAWEADPVALSADDALASDRIEGGNRNERNDAVDWLRKALADGPMLAEEVKQQAEQNGISAATLRRAKREAGVEAKREGFGPGAKWYWMLPEHHRCSPQLIDAHPKTVSTNGEIEHL